MPPLPLRIVVNIHATKLKLPLRLTGESDATDIHFSETGFDLAVKTKLSTVIPVPPDLKARLLGMKYTSRSATIPQRDFRQKVVTRRPRQSQLNDF
jgi:hypothetical protein